MKLGEDQELILSILERSVRPLRIAEILEEGLEGFTAGLRARGESSSKHQQQSARDSVSTLCSKLRHAGLAVSEGRPAIWSAVKPDVVGGDHDEPVDGFVTEPVGEATEFAWTSVGSDEPVDEVPQWS